MRYFSIHETAEILYFFARADRGSDELHDQLEKNFIKHRKALEHMPLTVEVCRKGYNMTAKGSEVLKRVLEDPAVELPKLE